jgi:hypothetical protein
LLEEDARKAANILCPRPPMFLQLYYVESVQPVV